MDALRPAQHGMRLVKEMLFNRTHKDEDSSESANPRELARLEEELAREREQNRVLQTRLAQHAEREIPDQEISPSLRSQRLLIPSLLEVAVLGDTVAEQWRAGTGRGVAVDASWEGGAEALHWGRGVLHVITHPRSLHPSTLPISSRDWGAPVSPARVELQASPPAPSLTAAPDWR